VNGLKLFVCTDHAGKQPVGVASVVLAYTEYDATRLLKNALEAQGLREKPFTLRQLDASAPRAFVLRDGDY
jgi:hypothetical protein